ncbi:hypothetical protein DPMN_149798 [Dreissena polymorpha]|uniref:Uncharacterized protein n=1 Tax=Dreissena polymorpha TaxID=45954 RepID=A0A9D4FGN9_DREPO|nr:hypothetical protein DPMN_149798 [Dreissena polymorpha]
MIHNGEALGLLALSGVVQEADTDTKEHCCSHASHYNCDQMWRLQGIFVRRGFLARYVKNTN